MSNPLAFDGQTPFFTIRPVGKNQPKKTQYTVRVSSAPFQEPSCGTMFLSFRLKQANANAHASAVAF